MGPVRNRLQSMSESAAIGPQFYTPGWRDFMAHAKGYDADMEDTPGPQSQACAHLNRIAIDPETQTMDTERLEPTDSGWLDLGGAPGTVVPMRRP